MLHSPKLSITKRYGSKKLGPESSSGKIDQKDNVCSINTAQWHQCFAFMVYDKAMAHAS